MVKPGAKVTDIDRIIESELERHKPSSIIVQVGVNNIGPQESSKLVSEYHGLLKKLSEARKPAIVIGILPRRWASCRRAIVCNCSTPGRLPSIVQSGSSAWIWAKIC